MRFLRVYVHENGGSMPFEALSAKARLIVPVGAIDSRCELRIPFSRIRAFSSAGRRAANPVPERYMSALNSGNAPRSFARSAEARYAQSRMTSEIFAAVSRAASES